MSNPRTQMKNLPRLALGAALASTSLLSLWLSTPAVPAGPGAVLEAVKAFTKAIDDGDLAYLRTAIDPRANKGGPGFHDLAFDGKSIDADTTAGFVAAFAASVKRRELEDVTTEIVRIAADCPSPRCSYAYLEFDRLIGKGKAQRVPMRATVLLRHTNDKPAFKIFHWNVSRRDGKAWPK